MDKIIKFITKENITFALALFGSFGTLMSWIFSFIRNRKNIRMNITRYFYQRNFAQFEFVILNKSKLPISITGIDLVINGNYYHTPVNPMVIQTITNRSGNQITSERKLYTVQLPINLAPISAASGYVSFALSQSDVLDISKPVTFQVCSNRGKAIEMKLELPPEDCEVF